MIHNGTINYRGDTKLLEAVMEDHNCRDRQARRLEFWSYGVTKFYGFQYEQIIVRQA